MNRLERHIEEYEQISKDYVQGRINTNDLLIKCSQGEGQIVRLFEERAYNELECQKAIVSLYLIMDEATKEKEKIRVGNIATKLNAESLTTDTKGGRSADWFTQTGKTFLSGVATNAIVCAIVNSQVGMAASHRNTITVDTFNKIALSMLRKEFLGSDYSSLVSENDLKRITDLAINETFSEFKKLHTGSFPQTGNFFMIGGVSQINTGSKNSLTQHIIKTLSSHPEVLTFTNTTNLDINVMLGSNTGIRYDGGSHPEYYVFI